MLITRKLILALLAFAVICAVGVKIYDATISIHDRSAARAYAQTGWGWRQMPSLGSYNSAGCSASPFGPSVDYLLRTNPQTLAFEELARGDLSVVGLRSAEHATDPRNFDRAGNGYVRGLVDHGFLYCPEHILAPDQVALLRPWTIDNHGEISGKDPVKRTQCARLQSDLLVLFVLVFNHHKLSNPASPLKEVCGARLTGEQLQRELRRARQQWP